MSVAAGLRMIAVPVAPGLLAGPDPASPGEPRVLQGELLHGSGAGADRDRPRPPLSRRPRSVTSRRAANWLIDPSRAAAWYHANVETHPTARKLDLYA